MAASRRASSSPDEVPEEAGAIGRNWRWLLDNLIKTFQILDPPNKILLLLRGFNCRHIGGGKLCFSAVAGLAR